MAMTLQAWAFEVRRALDTTSARARATAAGALAAAVADGHPVEGLASEAGLAAGDLAGLLDEAG